MEACVRDVLLNFWLVHAVIRPSQFGFPPRYGGCNQLISYLDRVTEIVDKGSWVDTVYLDLAKAFNTVSHRKLLVKLCSLGVKGDLLKWLESFLCGRMEVVSVLGEHSAPFGMTSGVPQGSVLGPLLLLLMLPMFDACINHASIFKYADDMKMYIE